MPVGVVVRNIAIGVKGLVLVSQAGEMGQKIANSLPPLQHFVRAVCPSAVPHRWALPIVTRFGVILQV